MFMHSNKVDYFNMLGLLLKKLTSIHFCTKLLVKLSMYSSYKSKAFHLLATDAIFGFHSSIRVTDAWSSLLFDFDQRSPRHLFQLGIVGFVLRKSGCQPMVGHVYLCFRLEHGWHCLVWPSCRIALSSSWFAWNPFCHVDWPRILFYDQKFYKQTVSLEVVALALLFAFPDEHPILYSFLHIVRHGKIIGTAKKLYRQTRLLGTQFFV